MPEQGERQTERHATGASSEQHPVLEDLGEAARMINDAAVHLSPTREFEVPHLEAADWPRDMDPAETSAMLKHLAGIAHDVSGCITGIACQHAVPAAAKPELLHIADLLTGTGRMLRTLQETAGQTAEGTPSPQDATLDFPDLPAVRPPGGTAWPSTPRYADPPTPSRRMTP